MTNKQIILLNNIVKAIQTSGHIDGLVGFYPEDYEAIGENTPAVLLIDGDENYLNKAGNEVLFDYQVSVMILFHEKVSKIATALSLQNKIRKLILGDSVIDGLCTFVKLASVNKGVRVNSDTMEIESAGYGAELNVRILNFVFSMRDDRS